VATLPPAPSTTAGDALERVGNFEPMSSTGSPAPKTTERQEIQRTVREIFGHDRLRPGQAEATDAVLNGHDVLLVLPTGAGKSLAYQLPAVLVDGPTIVISPLLALQRDQVLHLADGGERTQARRISSAETKHERAQALADAAAGEIEFLFMSPEQLANEEVLTEVAALRPSLVAVDEAHCVSSWGHDFRPDYLRLGELIAQLGSPRIIALTATAAPPVRDDILRRLRMRDSLTFVAGLARDNIHLAVHRCVTPRDQARAVVEAATSTAGPGIVYTGTRKDAEEYAALLDAAGLRAACYHAGLSAGEREDAYEAFMAGRLDVMTATSAFGMGVDKPDIRYVLHAQAPESPDNYYQEVGRAGRDGEPAVGVLFFRPEDLGQSRFFNASIPDPADVAAVVEALDGALEADQLDAVDREQLAVRTGFSTRKLGRIVNLLDEVRRELTPEQGPVLAAMTRADAHRSMQESRIDMMRGYAETRQCRRQFLLGYFGETGSGLCGECDNCRSGTAQEEVNESPYALQEQVRHAQFGDGVVMDIEGDQLTVLFTDVGYRTLSLPAVLRGGLLEPTTPR
jgi:ATP-dependent DNA helicase RecQ